MPAGSWRFEPSSLSGTVTLTRGAAALAKATHTLVVDVVTSPGWLSGTVTLTRGAAALAKATHTLVVRERCHRGFARGLVSMRGRTVVVVVATDHPHARPPLRRDQSYEDAGNENAGGDHV
jgi:hypothetical protein